MTRLNRLFTVLFAAMFMILGTGTAEAVTTDSFGSNVAKIDYENKVVYYQDETNINWDLLDQGYAICVPNQPDTAVTDAPSYEVVPYGDSKPSKVWNVATQGQCEINGSKSNVGPLYSSYLYTGCEEYEVKIVNNSRTNELNIVTKSSILGTTYTEDWLPKYSTMYYQITGRKTTDKFYFEFYPGDHETGIDVEGYIRER